jgi:hypothetical protein
MFKIIHIYIKLISDFIENIPLLTNIDPQNLLKLLICVKKINNFGLVSDSQLSSLLVSRLLGHVTQILGARLVSTPNWKGSELISIFLPPGLKKDF